MFHGTPLPPSVPESYTAATWLLTGQPGLFGLVGGLAYPTGVALVVVLTIIIVCSMKWVRKSGNFEVNWLENLASVPVYPKFMYRFSTGPVPTLLSGFLAFC